MMGVIKKTDNVTYTNFKLCCSVEVEMKYLMGIVTGSSSAGFALVIGFEVVEWVGTSVVTKRSSRLKVKDRIGI